MNDKSSSHEDLNVRRLKWLISKIKEAEESVHDTVDYFYMQKGMISEAHAANDCLDALREVFGTQIPELCEESIDKAMGEEN